MDKTKILVVDEKLVAVIIKKQLEDLDYDVVGIATTGNEAIETALEKNPDLILMDIFLKGDIDGIEAAKTIHSNNDIPIIYISTYFDDDILRRAK